MRWFGYTFSVTWWKKLVAAGPDADFPSGSYPLPRDSEYDKFFSYRGGTGRTFLHLTLMGEMNMLPAFWFLVCFCPPLVLIIHFSVKTPCESGVPRFLFYPGACSDPEEIRSWFLFLPYGGLTIILLVLLWHPLLSWFYSGSKLFVDKYC